MDTATNRQEIATAGKARLAMTGWWTGCGRKVAGTTLFGQKGSPFRSVHRGRAVAKIDPFLGRGNVCCTHNSARLEGSGEVALIAGAINSNPPQPASLVAFLPEQESYPPEELHPQLPQRVSFSTQKAPPNDIDIFDTLKTVEKLSSLRPFFYEYLDSSDVLERAWHRAMAMASAASSGFGIALSPKIRLVMSWTWCLVALP